VRQILVYADSLSWGIIPATRERLPFAQRWPGVLEGALLKDGNHRAALVAAARETVKTLGGALERTLAALDPYLVDLRMDRPQSHA